MGVITIHNDTDHVWHQVERGEAPIAEWVAWVGDQYDEAGIKVDWEAFASMMGRLTVNEVIVERNPAFLPKLITPGGKRSRVRPPALIWKTGPGNDRIELFRKKPRKGSRPINVRRGVISFIGGESVGRWKATFSWRYRYGTGRYWWRIVRTDSVSGYTETSAPRTFVIMGPRR